ncbi:hypothetical protein [Thalassotalea crassostreae]|uniref:hypothetical protein n=1 Tax=Thalassotalea crassostreae TaxID=1763536 RepID=UPI0012FE088C|nr:hypothetical protein [Thalassotalea crassostreae]
MLNNKQKIMEWLECEFIGADVEHARKPPNDKFSVKTRDSLMLLIVSDVIQESKTPNKLIDEFTSRDVISTMNKNPRKAIHVTQHKISIRELNEI